MCEGCAAWGVCLLPPGPLELPAQLPLFPLPQHRSGDSVNWLLVLLTRPPFPTTLLSIGATPIFLLKRHDFALWGAHAPAIALEVASVPRDVPFATEADERIAHPV